MAIHPSAIVDPKAELDSSVEVGPYSIIGPNVKIGARTKVGPHVVIEGHTTIGEDNHIFQFASLGAMPQDKKYAGEETKLEIGDRNTIREFCTFNLGTAQDVGVTVWVTITGSWRMSIWPMTVRSGTTPFSPIAPS